MAEKLTVNENFWAQYNSNPYLDWNTQDSAADTADEVAFAKGNIVAVRCTEPGFFRASTTGQTAANLRDHGRFTLAGETVLFFMTSATASSFLAYVANDSVAAKWQYCVVGNRQVGLV